MFINKVYLAVWFWLNVAVGFLYNSKLPVFLCDPWSLQEMLRNLWRHSRVPSLLWPLPVLQTCCCSSEGCSSKFLPGLFIPIPEHPQGRGDCSEEMWRSWRKEITWWRWEDGARKGRAPVSQLRRTAGDMYQGKCSRTEGRLQFLSELILSSSLLLESLSCRFCQILVCSKG